ncbi:hypothetical protein Taro_054961 [Colocasia esculenta]|uniref:Uncharacterized protein n=1 Tax=Colocasia esculenta TaxID=4460 RepID=A0A843XQ32_COLES|nr:hypothetical protein [Colocasia esculenta]
MVYLNAALRMALLSSASVSSGKTKELLRGACHVLIATLGDVAFRLPLFWLVVCMRAACRALDGCADVDRQIATGSHVATKSRRCDTSRSQPSCVFKKPWQNRAFTSSARPGEVLLVGFWAIRARGPRLVVFSPRGSRVEREKRRVIAVWVFFIKLRAPGSKVSQARGSARGLSRYSGTVRVLSSSWTPSLSGRVAVRLRERRQWDSDL